ncbi:MAG: hypothetical protein D6812_06200 [Deltaproteobacteria bacterium]|nr:MAG: hypothetical protein D6812_06200 [Deltaproteobacteria bacterium]
MNKSSSLRNVPDPRSALDSSPRCPISHERTFISGKVSRSGSIASDPHRWGRAEMNESSSLDRVGGGNRNGAERSEGEGRPDLPVVPSKGSRERDGSASFLRYPRSFRKA